MESNQNVTDQSDTRKRIEQLVAALNQASQAYYNGQDEIMSNYEWDQMFDELQMLEKETGYVMPESPTQNAGYEEAGGEKGEGGEEAKGVGEGCVAERRVEDWGGEGEEAEDTQVEGNENVRCWLFVGALIVW